MNDFSLLMSSASIIQTRAVAILEKWKNEKTSHLPALTPYIDLFTDSISGGKTIRGLLVTLGFKLNGHKENANILDIAAAFEIAHAALLVQDDVMDKSPLRRGKPSYYYALGADHHGVSQAICIGDLGLMLSMSVISNSNFDPIIKNNAASVFIDIILKTILGQMLDAHFAHRESPKSEDEILQMYKHKTAQYTISGPLLVGAILAGSKPGLQQQIKAFGENLGVAFQIKDDILGVFGDEKIVGKSVFTDIKEGKNTLLYIHTLQEADRSERKTLASYYGNSKLTDKQGAVVKGVLEKASLPYCQAILKTYVDQAKNLVPGVTSHNTKLAPVFYKLCDYLTERDK